MVFTKLAAIYLITAYLALLKFPQTVADSNYSVERANEYIEQNKNNVNQTYRLKYHFMAPIGWINDPNGFIYFKGEYHLFYQYNPYSSVWDKMHWGHAKSKDLVHWEDLPVALAPDQSYDNDGVFSGSAIEKDGKLYVMYTGNTAQGQVQCIAVSEDGINFEKVPENPVLDASNLPDNAQSQDFRDPKVLKHGDLYYVVLVSKTKGETGQVLLYQSEDLINWEFKSILLEGDKALGIMFECPDLFELDGRDVLLVSSIQMPKVGNEYQNIDTVLEFVGTVNWEKGTLEFETMKEIDHGLDFYATQTLLDENNRRIMIAWMNMWGRTFPTDLLRQGWTGAMTFPRELHVKDGVLIQTPVDELASIYQNSIELNNIVITDETKELDNIYGEEVILELEVNLEAATLFEIQLRGNDMEETDLSYNKESHELTLDRGHSGISITGGENPSLSYRRVNAILDENRLKLKILLDQISVEVFVNDGAESMTTTIYPTVFPSDRIKFRAEGSAIINSLKFSKLIP